MGSHLNLHFVPNPFFTGGFPKDTKYVMKLSYYGHAIAEKFDMPTHLHGETMQGLYNMMEWLIGMKYLVKFAPDIVPTTVYRPLIELMQLNEDIESINRAIEIFKFLRSQNIKVWVAEE